MIPSDYILAIESSCDDTSIALLGQRSNDFHELRFSQIKLHNEYGGVVPELASREHFQQIDILFQNFISQSEVKSKLSKISKVVATVSPGLIGPLLVGSSYARGLASAWKLPFEGIHHLRGHLASVLLSEDEFGDETFHEKVKKVFPSVVLLVSGGHTSILNVQEDLSSEQLAETADDSAGECFDKSAKLMGLPYPGGPAIEKLAQQLDLAGINKAKVLLKELPIPRAKEGFSFSGLKTAIRLQYEKKSSEYSIEHFAWAIQEIITLSLSKTLENKLSGMENLSQHKSIVFCGGVSANLRIRSEVEKVAHAQGLKLIVAPLKYCTDNAAMIAACARVQDPNFILHAVAPRLPL